MTSQLIVEQSVSEPHVVLHAVRSVAHVYKPQLVTAPVAHVPAPSHVGAAVCWFIVVSQVPAPQTVPAVETWHVPVGPVHE
jgi:hypothetical protein